jgi:hypothetical protein
MDTVFFYKDDAGEWRWHRKSENGRIVADGGEGYQNRQDIYDITWDMFADSVDYVWPEGDEGERSSAP